MMPTIEEQLQKLIKVLEEQEKENPSPVWLTKPPRITKKESDNAKD